MIFEAFSLRATPLSNRIGHSTGCRVVLETIEILRNRGHQTPVRKVRLMTAAMPTHEIYPGGRLSNALATPERPLVQKLRGADWYRVRQESHRNMATAPWRQRGNVRSGRKQTHMAKSPSGS